MQVSHVHVMLLCTQCLFTGTYAQFDTLSLSLCRVEYSIFYEGGGGGNISAVSRGSGGMLPQIIFCNIGL